MDAFSGGIVLAIAVIHFTNCQECCNFKMLSTTPPPESKLMKEHSGVPNLLDCARLCTGLWPCAFTQYCEKEGTCALYAKCANCTNVFVSCGNGKPPITVGFNSVHASDGYISPGVDYANSLGPAQARQNVSYSQRSRSTISPAPIVCGVNKYLVSGPDGVADSQLSESSFFCYNRMNDFCTEVPDALSAKYARLNTTGRSGSWTPRARSANDYIQVDFLTIRLTTGIVMTGRDVKVQYVTAFKVLYSLDCINFVYVGKENGMEKTFDGPSYLKEVVTRCFEQPIPVRCLRINPIAWVGWPSLRFDVLGY